MTASTLISYGLLVGVFVFMWVLMWLPTRGYQTSSWSFDGISIQFNGSSPGSAYSGGSVSPLGLVLLLAALELWRFASYRSQHYAISRRALLKRSGVLRTRLESWPRRQGLQARRSGRSSLVVAIPPPPAAQGPALQIRWRGLSNPDLACEVLRAS